MLHCLKFQAWVEMKYFLNLNIFSGASKIFSRDWRTIGNRIYRQPPALTHWASSFGCSGSRTGHVLFLEPASANLSSLSQVQNVWISFIWNTEDWRKLPWNNLYDCLINFCEIKVILQVMINGWNFSLVLSHFYWIGNEKKSSIRSFFY